MSDPTIEPQPESASASESPVSASDPISHPNPDSTPLSAPSTPRPPRSDPQRRPRPDRDPEARGPRSGPDRREPRQGERRPRIESGLAPPTQGRGQEATAADPVASDGPKSLFHHPYNFVPTPPRALDHPDLGDQPYAGLDRWRDDRFSGSIRVRMTVNTPLLTPDYGLSSNEGGVTAHPMRTDAQGKPEIAGTAIKGMLRAAFEAITNSRFGVFAGSERLSHRSSADGPRLQPARLERNKAGKLELRMLIPLKLKCYDADDEPGSDRPVEADRGRERVALRYDDQTLPEHGDKVWAQADVAGKVTAIVKFNPAKRPKGAQWRLGWVCITGPNARGKVYERVFIRTPNFEDELIPAEGLRESWEAVIRGYRDANAAALERRASANRGPGEYLGGEPGQTAMSRHLHVPGADQFEDGLLCYAERHRRTGRVINLAPVSAPRKLFDLSPRDLLGAGHVPAASTAQLSPADRVFGWADSTSDDGAGCKGLVRVCGVECQTPKEQAIQALKPPLPLAGLGRPRPGQPRFYVKSGNAGAQPDYQYGQRLRGRKVYPHHANLAADYWRKPHEDRTQTPDETGRRQEYRRPGGAAQNANGQAVSGWVAKGTEFAFTIQVTNLSQFELGALLWLLEMPARRFHRLGLGKPLGFGGVRLDWLVGDAKISMGDQIRAWQGSLTAAEPSRTTASELKEAVERFKAEIAEVARKPFEEAPQIAAWLRAAGGFEDKLPIHYPRLTEAPDPQRPAYEWFLKNSRRRQPFNLPDLVEDAGLPIDPS